MVEYDGSYWHADKTDADTAKTVALLDAGWRVIRIREAPLPHLGVIHANLTQLTHDFTHGHPDELVEAILDRLAAGATKSPPTRLGRHSHSPARRCGRQR